MYKNSNWFISILVTNCQFFQITLADYALFLKMLAAVVKMTFNKIATEKVYNRSYKGFDLNSVKYELKDELVTTRGLFRTLSTI